MNATIISSASMNGIARRSIHAQSRIAINLQRFSIASYGLFGSSRPRKLPGTHPCAFALLAAPGAIVNTASQRIRPGRRVLRRDALTHIADRFRQRRNVRDEYRFPAGHRFGDWQAPALKYRWI